MATRKSYAYQIKGNKLSLLENQFGYGSGQDVITVDGASINHKQYTLDEIGPTGKPSWVSPTSDVTDGIEIEYTYSPAYQLPFLDINNNQFGLIGWTIVDGYLTFISSGIDWTGSPETAIAADEHVYVGNSSRWTGIHKVKETQSYTGRHGGIMTYTKVNQSIKSFIDVSAVWDRSDSDVMSIHSLETSFNDTFPSSDDVPYLWITGSDASIENNGLFSNWTPDVAGYYVTMTNALRHDFPPTSELTPVSAAPVFSDDTSETVYIREAFYDPSYIVSDIDILSDESDTVDLPPYLSKALVYYVKAKQAEENLDIERKEYFMREFKKIVEKHENSKISGPRRIMGFGMTR